MNRSTGCVVAELNDETRVVVETLWSDLACRWSLRRAHPFGAPHLTLAVMQGNGSEARDRLQSSLAATAAEHAPFAARGAGYGVFLGGGTTSPVLHLAVTRTPELSALHKAVLSDIAAAGLSVEGQCLPDHWRPHINLADHEVTAEALGEAMRYLVDRRPRHWTFPIDNLTLLTDNEHLEFKVALSGVYSDAIRP